MKPLTIGSIIPLHVPPKVQAASARGDRVRRDDDSGRWERADDSSTFPALTEIELEARPDPTYDIDGMIPSEGFVTIIGAGESYKSFLAMLLAFCIQLGVACFGRAVRQADVFYVVGEGVKGTKFRVRAHRRVLGVDQAGIRFIPLGVKMTEPEEVERLLRTLGSLGYGQRDETGAFTKRVVVIFDTLFRCFRGNADKTEDMARFVEGCDRLRYEIGATVIVLHHTPWEQLRSRGSTSLPDAADAEILVERKGKEIRARVSCGKMKDGDHFSDMVLEFFPVNGTSSGVLRQVEAETPAAERPLELRILDMIRRSAVPVTKTAIRTTITGGRNAGKDAAIEELERRGWIEYVTEGRKVGFRVTALGQAAGQVSENSSGQAGQARGRGWAGSGQASGQVESEQSAHLPRTISSPGRAGPDLLREEARPAEGPPW